MKERSTIGMIDALNEAIAMGHNGERGFLLAARHSREEKLRESFTHYAQQRRRFVDELQSVVLELGGRPERKGDLAGLAHRMWMRLNQLWSRNKTEALLEDCLVGEAAALAVYEDVLSLSVAREARDVVEQQYVAIRAARDRLRASFDVAAA